MPGGSIMCAESSSARLAPVNEPGSPARTYRAGRLSRRLNFRPLESNKHHIRAIEYVLFSLPPPMWRLVAAQTALSAFLVRRSGALGVAAPGKQPPGNPRHACSIIRGGRNACGAGFGAVPGVDSAHRERDRCSWSSGASSNASVFAVRGSPLCSAGPPRGSPLSNRAGDIQCSSAHTGTTDRSREAAPGRQTK